MTKTESLGSERRSHTKNYFRKLSVLPKALCALREAENLTAGMQAQMPDSYCQEPGRVAELFCPGKAQIAPSAPVLLSKL